MEAVLELETQRAQTLTHSATACFRACHRRYQLRYEYGLRPEGDDLPRRVGTVFMRAVEVAANDEAEPFSEIEDALEDPYEMALVAAMYTGHVNRYSDPSILFADPEHVAAELEFDMPLINPETGKPTPVWRMGGKIDRIVRIDDGRLAVMEYKTTSMDFAPGSDYWTKLHLDPQLSIYVIAARELGYNIETVLYDVTRRPGLKPLKATPEENRKYKKDGTLYANQRDCDETPEEYAARVAADIAERPDYYFARIEIARLDADLDECRRDIWAQQQEMRAAQRTGHFYRDPGACFEISRKCDYVAICQNHDLDVRTPDGFVRLEDPHSELSRSPSDEG